MLEEFGKNGIRKRKYGSEAFMSFFWLFSEPKTVETATAVIASSFPGIERNVLTSVQTV